MNMDLQVENESKTTSTLPDAEVANSFLRRAPDLDAKRVVKFLEDLANCNFGDAKARNRFSRRFGDLCQPNASPMAIMMLRLAWEAQEVRDREMYLLQAISGLLHEQRGYREGKDSFESPGPMWDVAIRERQNLVDALWYAAKNADRLRVCPNSACGVPLFVARNRNQKFCCEICALPSIKQSKKQWWAAERARRAGRKKKQSGKRG